uniref:Uncharacterized protein n=1 Tax=Oryza brachyantha TaxID=4533 RepID=J3MS37_ORYBR
MESIGPVRKKNVMKANVMLERKKEYATILAFDVKVMPTACDLAEESGVKVLMSELWQGRRGACSAPHGRQVGGPRGGSGNGYGSGQTHHGSGWGGCGSSRLGGGSPTLRCLFAAAASAGHSSPYGWRLNMAAGVSSLCGGHGTYRAFGHLADGYVNWRRLTAT